MRLQQIEPGTRLRVFHGSSVHSAIVNGEPYVVGLAGAGAYPNLIVRIPCHLPETNENVDLAGSNVREISEDA
jgi:hypothetical protein